MSNTFDIAIIGSGFGGSLLAQICRRLGRTVVLLERDSHPRFAIGESSTPLANLLLEELATQYGLPRILPFAKWGAWQREYPQVVCGLKRGFTFLHHRLGKEFEQRADRQNQLLVAASPRDQIADTHWFRADFDHFFVQEAQAAGAKYFDQTALTDVEFSGHTAVLSGNRNGQQVSFQARLVVDASGPRSFLHGALELGSTPVPGLPRTQALFNHFTRVRRLDEVLPGGGDDAPPFPLDDAAVHHVFDGGWIWVLHFNNGVTSAGAAVTESLGQALNLSEGAPGWGRLLALLPTVQEQFRDAKPEMAFRYSPNLSFRSNQIAGEWWALLPSAAGFVDPLLSTGFPLTLFGIKRLAVCIDQHWGTERFALALKCYETQTAEELNVTGQLISALYANMGNFPLFAALTRIYFAAASFGETMRRLGFTERAGSFLMHDVPGFGPPCRRLVERAMRANNETEAGELVSQIAEAITPFDVAGLCDSKRRNWHPADAADLFEAAGKLNVSKEEISAMLVGAGFY